MKDAACRSSSFVCQDFMFQERMETAYTFATRWFWHSWIIFKKCHVFNSYPSFGPHCPRKAFPQTPPSLAGEVWRAGRLSWSWLVGLLVFLSLICRVSIFADCLTQITGLKYKVFKLKAHFVALYIHDRLKGCYRHKMVIFWKLLGWDLKQESGAETQRPTLLYNISESHDSNKINRVENEGKKHLSL